MRSPGARVIRTSSGLVGGVKNWARAAAGESSRTHAARQPRREEPILAVTAAAPQSRFSNTVERCRTQFPAPVMRRLAVIVISMRAAFLPCHLAGRVHWLGRAVGSQPIIHPIGERLHRQLT